MKQYDYLIVGSGLYGAVFAQQAATKGKKVLIMYGIISQSLRNLIVLQIHQLQTIRENYILFRLICIHSIRCGE